MLRMFREFLQWRRGDCIVLAEANVLPDTAGAISRRP
jgi:maltose alpha-D-glucosyltransferase/alpha-amylase